MSLRQELDDRATMHRALALDGTSEGAVKGWEGRRGESGAEKFQRESKVERDNSAERKAAAQARVRGNLKSLDGTSEGATKGWDARRGVGSHDESSRRSHEGYGGSRTPAEGDRVTVKGNVAGAGKGGRVVMTAPSGSFHVVEHANGKQSSYHSSNLKVKDMQADAEDRAIALGVARELSSQASKHRALSLATKE